MKKYSSYFNKKYLPGNQEETEPAAEETLPSTTDDSSLFTAEETDPAPDPLESEFPLEEPSVSQPEQEFIPAADFQPPVSQEPVTEPAANTLSLDNVESDVPADNEATIISKSAIINGELTVQGDVHMFGKIKGNLTAYGNLEIAGKVIGNVAGNDVELSRCELKGDINAKGFVFMDKESIMIGNLTSQDITLDGKVKGDVNASHKIYVRSNAIIVGNVKAAMIAIDEGAALQGQVIIAEQDGQSLSISDDGQPAK